jgi:S1-C subfamily serine protease
MKKKVILCLLALMALVSGCKKAMNPEEIYNKCAPGVVLIYNEFYYSITLPDGDQIYFTGVDRNGDLTGLTFKEEEAKANRSGCTGTGFFITTDGQIMTNRHVASPQIDRDDVKAFLKGLKKSMKNYYKEKMDAMRTQFYQYEGQPGVQQKIAQAYEDYSKALENTDDMDMNDADIETHTSLRIVYNDSHVVNEKDLDPCSTVAVSDVESIDLAIIQLDSHETPADAYVFPLRDEADGDDITLDQKLYIIGFNKGFSVAKTTQGYRSQIYSGNVTQKSDGEDILYSIASLPGSSGSPVIDEYGNVVAVHYAGMSTTQNFNYGIPLKKVRQFLKEN